MEEVARVVLAMEEHDVAEEVMHFLDRSGRARVVATAEDASQLSEAVRQLDPDAVVGQPLLARRGTVRGASFIAVDTRESVGSLRAAIDAGAVGYFVWPADRDGLIGAAASANVPSDIGERTGRVVAIFGSRGGAGATFVSTHLASAFARQSRRCTLIDADPVFGDVASVLGGPPDDVHTLADLVPLVGELQPSHVEGAAWRHPAGFGVLFAPPPEEIASVGASELRTVIEVAAIGSDAVVVHLPRDAGPIARAAISTADRIVVVLTLDVPSFRAAKRVLEVLGPNTSNGKVGFVVNRAVRAEIVAADVERVFGASPLVVLPFDRDVPRAQDRGRTLGDRGRMARAFDRLVSALDGEHE